MHVVRFNGSECEAWYRELLETTHKETNCPQGGANELADFLRNVATEAGLPDKLEACGVEHGRLSYLAEAAACQWTASFNPIAVGRNELLKLYEEAY
jgi:alcohol dehydrogenase class IV